MRVVGVSGAHAACSLVRIDSYFRRCSLPPHLALTFAAKDEHHPDIHPDATGTDRETETGKKQCSTASGGAAVSECKMRREEPSLPLLTVQNGEEVTVPPANAIANYHAAHSYSCV